MIEIEESSGNVYADLGMADAGEMSRKAQLASKIGEIIKGHGWSQQTAADHLQMTQPKLSNMLRGQFRGISETKMLECLTLLGHDVTINIAPIENARTVGTFTVRFEDRGSIEEGKLYILNRETGTMKRVVMVVDRSQDKSVRRKTMPSSALSVQNVTWWISGGIPHPQTPVAAPSGNYSFKMDLPFMIDDAHKVS